jgi:hypothetical protein
MQDNESLSDEWMQLLRAQRESEIAALQFIHSLLEEVELDQDDPQFGEKQDQAVQHKTRTLKRLVEELNPKAISDQIITHWNLSYEGILDEHKITPVLDDDVTDPADTAVPIIRPGREMDSEVYTLEEQMDHCIHIAFLCYGLFDAVINAPELKSKLFSEIELPRKDGETVYTKSDWQQSKTKVFDYFWECVAKMHHAKYLHFLFGVIEVVRGTRIQKLYFLNRKSIRIMKEHSLVKQWQDACCQEVDRSGPESRIDDFSDRVQNEYISFVQHQWYMKQQPWPLNSVGDMMAFCIKMNIFIILIMTPFIVIFYQGSYTHRPNSLYGAFFLHSWQLLAVQLMAVVHMILSTVWTMSRVLAYSSWVIEKSINEWKEENPRQMNRLDNPLVHIWFELYYFVSDPQLEYLIVLNAFSILGFFVDPLWFSMHMIDVCANVNILAKVLLAMQNTASQVMATVIFGFFVQYCFVSFSFMLFDIAYQFPDKDTSRCDSLYSCTLAHFDYGFRGGPVWTDTSTLTWGRTAYDYFYYMVVILILAAIISGIIIDTFADMRTTQASIDEDMTTLCFICSFNRSQIERAGVKFHHHIYQEHYMWAYARFLLHLEEADKETLTGAESRLKEMVARRNFVFYPIHRATSLETADSGEAHQERSVRVKDMSDIKVDVKKLIEDNDHRKQYSMDAKTTLDDLGEDLESLQQKMGALVNTMTTEGVIDSEALQAAKQK